jgi:hypothetical protein
MSTAAQREPQPLQGEPKAGFSGARAVNASTRCQASSDISRNRLAGLGGAAGLKVEGPRRDWPAKMRG